MHRPLVALLAVATLVGCARPAEEDRVDTTPRRAQPEMPTSKASPASSIGSTTGSPVAASSARFLPAPGARIPSRPGAVAASLERTTDAVRAAVDSWIGDGDPSRWPPPHDLVLLTLYQERIYRSLAQRPRLGAAVMRRLSGSVGREARAILGASADIFRIATPVPPSYRMRTRAPAPAAVLLDYYREAERRFAVPWQVLAAVNYVESKFGRVVSNSSAGAHGPMQFLSSTWRAYGLGGDVHDPHDAIVGAANYLHANGAPSNMRGALYRYNPVREYVDAVTTYADAIRRDPRLYYALYCWQVYVLTTHGDRRVTGPGR